MSVVAPTMEQRRTYIAHLDLDCFFVSVERIYNPSLRKKPVVVAAHPQQRGVVASASYEARAHGIHAAMPTAEALRLYPKLIVVPPRHSLYSELSHRLFRRLCDIAPVVVMASIDEMNMDFTGCEKLYKNDFDGLLRTIQRLVAAEFKLPCTLALSSNVTLSKIAANQVKPNGICIVPPGKEQDFLAPLDVGVIPGVGKKTECILKQAGFLRIADIQRSSLKELTSLLGAHGVWLYETAMGKGPTTLTPDFQQKSISREETFLRDILSPKECQKHLFALTEECCFQLRSQAKKAQTVSIKLRYSDFTTITRSQSIPPTNDDTIIFQTVLQLFKTTYTSQHPLRLLGVRLSNFTAESQLHLFSSNEKKEKLFAVVDEIRKKYGKDIIHIGQST